MRSVGKQAHDESGKHPVNEIGEEIFARDTKGACRVASSNAPYRAEASLRAKRSNPSRRAR
jgi:hypothetical protein